MKTALVTGASEGIGREMVLQLAREGYAVTAVARNEVRLRELVAEAGGAGDYLAADLTTDVARVIERLTSRHYDLVVNNAGYGIYGRFDESKLSDAQNMIALNCAALVEISHAYLKTSRAGDALVNVSSIACRLPMPIAAVYTATKAFVTDFTEGLWWEQRSRGVYVMALCPGSTITNFMARAGGTNDQIPSVFAQMPAQVAERMRGALKSRSAPIVFCGPTRPAVFLANFLPRKWIILLAGRVLKSVLSR